ncbi:MAG: hypothetical protein RIM33_15350 [Alphaproteobacteria bacterium]
MTQDPNSMGGNVTEDRLIEILDAYGADPLAWPERERYDAQRLAADPSPRLAAALDDAAALDQLLSRASVPEMSDAAIARLVADAKPGQFAKVGRLFSQLSGWTGPIWQPAGALACALFLGIGVGVAEPDFTETDDDLVLAKTMSTEQIEKVIEEEDIFGFGGDL